MKLCYAIAAILAANASAAYDPTWGDEDAKPAFDAASMGNKQTVAGPTATTKSDPVETYKGSFQFSWSSEVDGKETALKLFYTMTVDDTSSTARSDSTTVENMVCFETGHMDPLNSERMECMVANYTKDADTYTTTTIGYSKNNANGDYPVVLSTGSD